MQRRLDVQENEIARYERMVEIREVEEQIFELFAAGEVRGTTHLCQGQEALAVGLASILRPTDAVLATYRGHGIALALGLTPQVVLAEVMGKVIGCCGGVGGSMHMCDMSLGLLPTSTIVGAGIPIAAFGVGAYGLIIIAAIVRGPLASMIGLIIAFAGLLFSAYLKYLEIFQIGAICQWCLVSTVAIVICFLLSLARFRITEKDAIK